MQAGVFRRPGSTHASAEEPHYTPDQIDAWAGLLQPDRYTDVIRERAFVVAEAGGSVMGFGQLDAECGEVAAVYVDPPFARRGVGRMLLAHPW